MKNSFKETCIKLREKDYTLGEIMEVTGRSKTSVYFHIKNIPLSQEKQREIQRKYAKHIKKYPLARKGKSKRAFRKIRDWKESNVLLVAHLIFDGEITNKSCVYHNSNSALVKRVHNLMKEIYKYDPKEQVDKVSGVMRVSYHNVALSNYLNRKSQELLKEIPRFPIHLKKAFLKAFFDDEGSITYDKKISKRNIRGYQKDKKILSLVQNLLKEFGIESTVDFKYGELTIGKRSNLEKFAKEINFSPGVKINSGRKNSIWEKDLEKRKILQMALDSYQD